MARRLRCLLVAGALLAPAWASAAEVRFGLGADYRLQQDGVFSLTLGVASPLGRHLQVGGRFGGLLTSSGPVVGVPLDLQLRALLGGRRVYLEGLAGPWLFFSGAVVRAHAAIGFGLQTSFLSVGLELGWLQPHPMVGLRLGFSV